jgi:hypothetical protein
MADEIWVKTWPANPNAKPVNDDTSPQDPMLWECLWPDLINEILADSPPPTLFHYATPAATISILQNRELWASGGKYLNDASEFQLAHRLFDKLLDQKIEESTDDGEGKFLKEVRRAGRMMKSSSYLVSLSEDGDLLSQWRAYAPEGGYALGFSSERLRELTRPYGYWLVRCVYSSEQQRARIDTIINRLLDWYRHHIAMADRPVTDLISAGRVFAMMWMAWLPPTLKHSSYAEEREWRLVHFGMGAEGPRRKPRFRATKAIIVPYDAVPISDGAGACISEVVVGPGPYQQLASDPISDLLMDAGVLEYRMRLAEAPHLL